MNKTKRQTKKNRRRSRRVLTRTNVKNKTQNGGSDTADLNKLLDIIIQFIDYEKNLDKTEDPDYDKEFTDVDGNNKRLTDVITNDPVKFKNYINILYIL